MDPTPEFHASVGLLSTFPPTQCGLATFTAALAEQLPRAGVVRVVDAPEPIIQPGVVALLDNGDQRGSAEAAVHLNRFDVAVVQHEYGIYGGPDGRAVLDVVDGLSVPLVVVFHTVLVAPTLRQRRILQRLLAVAEVAVTMTETARERLIDLYGADPSRVVRIPHGAAAHTTSGVGVRRAGRPTVLTWGLLGPGKGIEWAIAAIPELRDLSPRYLVLGRTHPKVLAAEGEKYRWRLRRQIDELGVGDLVELDDSYLEVSDLAALVEQADVVLLPYDSKEQVTSGVLIEAVAAGRPVISTSFPHATELLGDGTGVIVAQRSPRAIAAALRQVLTDATLSQDMATRAAEKSPELSWPAVGARYQQVADALAAAALEAAS